MTDRAKENLQRRLAALSEEIRHYPTPIARCDEQLAGLLEERARVLKSLNEIQETTGGCDPIGIWTDDGGFNAA
ncbi:MAG: hypothetical protein AAB325_08205 [Pseudomonadota bacterium]